MDPIRNDPPIETIPDLRVKYSSERCGDRVEIRWGAGGKKARFLAGPCSAAAGAEAVLPASGVKSSLKPGDLSHIMVGRPD